MFPAASGTLGPGLALGLALAILALGPVISVLSQRARWALRATDGFVLTGVGALALLHVGPRVLADGGAWAIVALAVGLAFPALLERTASAAGAERLTFFAAIAGLALHAAFDGATLAHADEMGALAAAVLVHRLPEGIFVWWLARPWLGRWGAAAAVGFIGLSTTLGFALGREVHFGEPTALGVFQAFVTGALLHVLLGHGPSLGDPRHSAAGAWDRLAEIGGAAAGLVFVFFAGEEGAHAHAHGALPEDFGDRFVGLALTAAPALLAGYAAAVLIVVLRARGAASATQPAANASPIAAPAGVLLGVTSPARGSAVARACAAVASDGGAARTVAFAVSAPALAVEALVLTLPLLGWRFALVRALAAAAMVLAASWLADLLARPRAASKPSSQPPVPPETAQVLGALRAIVDQTAGWVLLGLAFAAAGLPEWLSGLHAATAGLLVAALALPIPIGAAGATLLATALLDAGALPSAALILVLVGPATSIAVTRALATAFGARAAAAAVVVPAAIALALAALIPQALLQPAARAAQAPSALGWACLAALAALYAATLFRFGPRALVLSVLHLDHHHPA